MDIGLIGIVSLVVFASTAFQAVAGFGYAIVAAPVLVPFLGVKETVVFLLVSSVYMRIYMLYSVRKDMHFDMIKYIALGAVLGAVPGSLFLHYVDAKGLEILLGTSLILAVIFLSCNFRWHTNYPRLEQFFFGLFGGFFNASTSIGGPVVVLYMLNAKIEKVTMRGNLTLYFMISCLCSIAISFFMGNIVWQNLIGLPMWALPASVLGVYVGNIIFKHVNQKMFNRIAVLLILFCGIHMIVQGFSK